MTAPDLHAIALAAIRTGDHALADAGECGRPDEQAAVAADVLAVVLPAHRAQVAREVVTGIREELARCGYVGATAAVAVEVAVAVAAGIAHAQGRADVSPATPPSAPQPAQDGPPVPEEAPEAQRGVHGDAGTIISQEVDLGALVEELDRSPLEWVALQRANLSRLVAELTEQRARAERAEAERDEYVAEAEWHRLAAEQAEATIARYEPVIHAARKWRHPASGIRAEGMTDDEARAALLNALAGAVDTLDGTEEPTQVVEREEHAEEWVGWVDEDDEWAARCRCGYRVTASSEDGASEDLALHIEQAAEEPAGGGQWQPVPDQPETA